MTDLTVMCFAQTGDDNTTPAYNKYLGTVTISTLSTTSQSAALPAGTRYVSLSVPSSTTVDTYFKFGKDSATAVTTDQRLRSASGEFIQDTFINGKTNNVIAARIA